MSGGMWLALDTATEIASVAAGRPPVAQSGAHVQGARRHAAEIIRLVDFALSRLRAKSTRRMRSEEHTSELQSRLHLVCRLLLEKKKKSNTRVAPRPLSPVRNTKRPASFGRYPCSWPYSAALANPCVVTQTCAESYCTRSDPSLS